MTETSALNGNNPIQSSCWNKVVESKWMDASLIIGFVALLIIGIAASIGAFSAIGTTNATYLSYVMYAGAALCLTAEIAKLIRNYCCKDNRPDSSYNRGASQLNSENTNPQFDGRSPLKSSGSPSQSLVTTNVALNHPGVEIVTEETVDLDKGTVHRSITGTATTKDKSGGNVHLEQKAQEIKGPGYTITSFRKSYEGEIDGMPASEWMKKNGVNFS